MKRKKYLRYFAFFMALNILFETISPSLALALNNKYAQPELVGFEQANTSEMVDLFTGDFKYNIPLMDVDGYPLNISYHAGNNMESEASWVGLGWSLSPGVLNKAVKGLPDDFNGEQINSNTYVKPYASMGVGFQHSTSFGYGASSPDFANIGVGGKIAISGAVIVTYNNYKGYGLDVELDGQNSTSASIGLIKGTASQGIGLKLSSQDGGTISNNYSYGVGVAGISVNTGESNSVNTRNGAMSKSKSLGVSANFNGFGGGASLVHSLPAGSIAYSPSITNDYKSSGFSISFKPSFWGATKLFINFFPIPGTNVSASTMLGYKGFYSTSQIQNNINRSIPAYGYMYSHNAPEDALMDFNRFKDGVLMQETPNIHLTSNNYDIYSASAQGMAFVFRPFRSDVGIYHDNIGKTTSKQKATELEIGAGNLLHNYNALSSVVSTGKSGYWNTMLNSLNFKKISNTNANPFVEQVYFKKMGEITARDAAYESSIGGDAPVKALLIKSGNEYEAASPISNIGRTKRDKRNEYIESLTANQATIYGFEKTYNLYNKGSFVIDPTNRMVTPSSTINRIFKNSTNVGHHISEIGITNTDGARYYYGIPVYNLSKKRVIFNASSRKETAYSAAGWPPISPYTSNPLTINPNNQLLTYSAQDIGANNLRGADNFVQNETTPAFATNYLLTTIVSPDYVDLRDDGPTYDDLGNFTRFNYYKSDDDYNWREPFCDNVTNSFQAYVEKGLLADELDDKAMYEHGTRENYYMHSVETKNYVAIFETSARQDAFGANDENGGISSSAELKLDAIKLYSKSEIIAKGSVAAAIPIKTVRFEYDYYLCPGTYNSKAPSKGKLTLRKIYYSYANSEKSALNPYQFNYTSSENFSYNPVDVDRWGNYKLNNPVHTGNTTSLNNIEYPYAEQDRALANSYANAWNLNEIITPSGSKIKVTYESDDYGYVQGEQAGQMIKVLNMVDNLNPNSDNPSSYPFNTNIKDLSYIIVDLQGLQDAGIPTVDYNTLPKANAFAKTNLIKLNKKLFYKFFMKLVGKSNASVINKDYYDFVSGYATVEDVGLFEASISGNTYVSGPSSQSFYKYAYIRVKKEIAYESKDVNPITMAGWDYLRNYHPRLAYPGSEPANMGDASHKPKKLFKNILAGLGTSLADMVNGIGGKPNKRFYNKNFCTYFVPNKSFLRAYVPLKRKMGGGYRVKSIITEDNWDVMTNNQEAKTSYGQVFDYTIKEGKHVISSGVASYEPINGGDEISLRQPIEFTIQKTMAPNDHFFQEEPFGEMMYPSPVVGYSRVTVTNIPDPSASVAPNVCKIGKTEYDFYTAKDFPISYSTTGLNTKLLENDLIEDFIVNPVAMKVFHASQGHALKFNDMHGKLKAVSTFGEDNLNAPISGVRYNYKSSGPSNGLKQLITTLPTINEKNIISNANMCKDVDIAIDTRENLNESTTLGFNMLFELGGGTNMIIVPAVPLPIISFYLPWPFVNAMNFDAIYGEQQIGVKTVSTTKVIQQYGVLESVYSFDNKSSSTTQNLLWDQNTGEVVLTKTTNNLNQEIFNYNYPAYWAYPDMGHEFKRDGIELLRNEGDNTIFNPSTGVIDRVNVSTPMLLRHGDEVRIIDLGTTSSPSSNYIPIASSDKRFWVMTLQPSSGIYNYQFFDVNGNALSGLPDHKYIIQVIKPVDENNLYASVGNVVSKYTPIVGSAVNFNSTNKIIDANVQTFCTGSALTFSDGATQQSYDNVFVNTSPLPWYFNQITSGFYGTHRPNTIYKYNVNRIYNTQPTIKEDGYYSNFLPYWVYVLPSTAYYYPRYKPNPAATSNWMIMSINTYYSSFGELLESTNAIGLNSAQRMSFNHTLPAYSVSNSKVDESAFDSFEDYSIYPNLNNTNIVSNDYIGFYSQLGSSGPSLIANAHTGRFGLLFNSGNSAHLTHYFNKDGGSLLQIDGNDSKICNSFQLNQNKLNLLPDKKYILSMWIKGTTNALDYSGLVTLSINANWMNPTTTSVITPSIIKKTGIINGWQKIDYQFSTPIFPIAATNGAFHLNISNGSGTAFTIDDFRLHPFNANMVSSVYDPLQLRLWAQLDDRNYATIFEYDNEGMLVRKKKETEKGIYTTQESRNSLAK
jgi:hypothetical protein